MVSPSKKYLNKAAGPDIAKVRHLGTHYELMTKFARQVRDLLDGTTEGLNKSAVLSIGTSADDKVKSTDFSFFRDGACLRVASAETALAAGTVPADKWGLWLVSVQPDGTLRTTGAAANGTTGYNTEALAIAAKPATPAGDVAVGYFTVLTAVGQPFVADTDALQGGAAGNPSSDTNYYDGSNTDLYKSRLTYDGTATLVTKPDALLP